MEMGGGEELTAVDYALEGLRTAVGHLVKLVEDGGLDGFDDAGLFGFARGFEQARPVLALVDHQVVAQFEGRRVAERVGQPSTKALLAWLLRLSPGEASRRVRAADQLAPRHAVTGEALEPLRPALAAVQRDGQASPEQVDICLRALAAVDHRGFDPADLDAADRLLAGFARSFPPAELRGLAAQVVDRIDPDGSLPDDQLQADRRHLAFRKTRDGMYAVEGRLTGVAGAKLQAVLGPLAAPRVETVILDGGREVNEPDPRHHGQRTHDALEDVCDRLLRSGTLPDSGGTPATVIITVTDADLTARQDQQGQGSRGQGSQGQGSQGQSSQGQGSKGESSQGRSSQGQSAQGQGAQGQGAQGRRGHGTTSDGTTVSMDAVVGLADQAEVITVVLDARGAVLDLGRTRRCASRTQTMALIARDGGCSFPGCDRPPEWCERHHILAWVDSGRTDLANLTLLCAYHHHHFASRGWTCLMIDGLPAWTPPRWIDPHRRPLRNTRSTARHHAQRLRC